MSNQKAGIAFIVPGAVLILSALLLFFYNRKEEEDAGRKAEHIMQELQNGIPVTTIPPSETESTGTAETDSEMTVMEIDGYDYIGYIEIPILERELPVMAEWDDARLKIAPCRQFGSAKTDDLVIAAHNYKSHFGPIRGLEAGEQVIFTDMDGNRINYEVIKTETLQPTAVESVLNSGCDLVLYTCTYGGRSRVAVFCDRTQDW